MKDKSTLAPGFASPKPSVAQAGLERLERALAHQGLASRREAKALIVAGLVKVNGKVIKEPGFGIKVGTDKIEIKGDPQAGKQSVLVYKPTNIETNKTASHTKDLHDYFPQFKHLAPIGRLDKDSEGLIIMSNDGSLARAMTQENSHIAKTYVVTVRENVTDEAIKRMSTGIVLPGKNPASGKPMARQSKPAVVKRVSRTSFSIVLHEGRKHQIRRMCDACHLTVVTLVRTNIGFMSIGSMKPGAVRILNEEDVAKLKK